MGGDTQTTIFLKESVNQNWNFQRDRGRGMRGVWIFSETH